MSLTSPLSRAAKEMLARPAAPGGRHRQIVSLACELIRSGLNPESIFWQLRPRYEQDVSDKEIRDAIAWAARRTGGSRRPTFRRAVEAPTSPEAAAKRFLAGSEAGEADLWEASPIRPPERWQDDAACAISFLYQPGEYINIVTASDAKSGRPLGQGLTLKRDEWLQRIGQGETLSGRAGVWVRMNPTDGRGIGDANITSHRFLLLESDQLPKPLQLSLFAALPLPFSLIATSGGKSIHGWVRLDAVDSEAYRKAAAAIFRELGRFGLDTANRNPSRLSRLPGVKRQIGGVGEGLQRILYLNPDNRSQEAIR